MTPILKLFIGLLTINLQLVAPEDLYDYDSINPFREIERIGRQIEGHEAHDEHHHTKIQELNVQCTKSGLTVSVEFDGPFDGVIYSKGYFSDPKCRFVEVRTGAAKYNFDIPAGRCGTNLDEFGQTISNVLIFQMDETVQEIWDVAKKISCKYGGANNAAESPKTGKMVIFKPLSVGMLNVQHEPISNGDKGSLDCWMDIQKGTYPHTEPIGGQIEIGEELSVIIYLKDAERQYDASVKDCWAYDSERFDDARTSKVQLTGYDGCPRKTKLIGRWMKTFETGDTGATTIAFTNMTAFKFPDSDNIYLTCNIELCKDVCDDTCGSVAPAPQRPLPTQKVLAATRAPYVPQNRPPTTTHRPFVNRPNEPDCYEGSRDARCSQAKPKTPQQTSPPFRCTQNSADPRCVRPTANALPETTRRPICYKGSTDARCHTEHEIELEITQRPTVTGETANLCYPGAVHPRCPPDCAGNGAFKDPRCAQPTTRPTIPPTQRTYPTTRPTYATTPKPVNCYPGAVDPRCPPDCEGNGAFKDPRCAQPTTRPTIPPTQRTYPTTRPTYETTQRTYPTTRPTYATTQRTFPTTRPTYATTPKPVNCYPGAVDPRCPPDCEGNGAFKDPRCAQPTTRPTIPPTQRTYPTPRPTYATTPKPVNCYPGAVDPRCPPDCEGNGAFKDPRCAQPTTRPTIPPTQRTYPTTQRTYPTTRPTYATTPKPVNCYPGAVDPRCPPDCNNNGAFKDPRCAQPTTRPTIAPTQRTYPTTRQTYATTSKPVNCYPGAVDPRCPPDCEGNGAFKDPRCAQPTTRPTIAPTQRTYPTTRPTYATTSKPVNCYPGAVDPRCPPACNDDGAFKDPRCAQPTTRPTIPPTQRTYPTTQRTYPTTRPTYATTPKPVNCYPGAVDPRCPPDCNNNGAFKDPRCAQPTTRPTIAPTQRTYPTTRQTYATTPKPVNCYPGAVDPRCPPDCEGNGAFKDPRCAQPTTRPTIAPTQRTYPTTRPTYATTQRTYPTTRPTYATTSKPINCYPGAIDPRCPPDCEGNGAFKDPRCAQPTTPPTIAPTQRTYPTTRPTYATTQRTYPTTRPTYATTSKPVNCYPGAVDPRCPPDCNDDGAFKDPRCAQPTARPTVAPTQRTYPTTQRTYPTTRPTYATTQRTFPTTRPTYATTQRTFPTTRPTYATTSKPINCYPGAIDPRCPPDCEGSGAFKDPRCAQPTTPPTIAPTERTYPTTRPTYATTPKPVNCYPGAVDPRCPPDCNNNGAFKDPRCAQPTTRPTAAPTQRTYPTTRPTYATTQRTYPTTRPTYATTQRTFPTTRPTYATTSKPVNCYPGAVDPRCPPDCDNNGAFKDPRCAQPTTRPTVAPTQRTYPTTRPTYATTQRTYPTTRPTYATTQRTHPTTRPTYATTQRTYPTTRPTYATTQRTFPTTRPTYATTPKPVNCYPGAVDPRCPPDCEGNGAFKDPRCEQPTTRPTIPPTQRTYPTPRPTYATTSKPVNCYPGAVDPRCPPDCEGNGAFKDPRCAQPTTRPTIPPTQRTYPTTQRTYPTTRPTYATTSKPVNCYPGAVDPRCPPDCNNNGAFKDPRCAQPTTRPTAAPTQRTYPTTQRTYPTTRPTYETTPKPVNCYPGAVDPRCPPDCEGNGTFKDPRCAQPTARPTYATTSKPVNCYPGAVDPRCPPDCDNNGAFKDPRCAQPTTRPTPALTQRTYPTTRPTYATTTKPVNCYPGTVDPRCPPDCDNNGSFKDPRCVTSSVALVETTRRPICFPGSTDSRCSLHEEPQLTEATSKKPLCYPGQIDPRCPPICPSTDIRCRGI